MFDANTPQWFIASKIAAPRQNIALVERPDLIRALDRAIGHRLGIVVAPPGYGKTTLLSQWRNEALTRGVRVAWLALDEDDNDARLFLSYVVLGLISAGLAFEHLRTLAHGRLADVSPRSVLASIYAGVAAQDHSVVLILDDFHRVSSTEVSAMVKDIVARAPDNLTLLINARTRPNIDLPRLLASGQAIEINAGNLRLTTQQIRQALDQDIPDKELAILAERTEGWAIAVQLARFLIAEDQVGLKSLAGLKGNSGHFASYLSDQIIETLSHDAQTFLMHTSILERVNAELAGALVPNVNAWEMLRKLEPLNALLVPIDGDGGWFRYHHLFAEYLQDMLRRQDPEIIPRLHLAASQWFERAGQVQQAVSHSKQAGDWSRCATLIESTGGWKIILFSGIGLLRTLAEGIPAHKVQEFPRLAVAMAYLALKDGKIKDAQNLLSIAESKGLRRSDDGKLATDFTNVNILVGIYQDRWQTSEGLVALETLASNVSSTDNLSLGIVYSGLFHAYIGQGNFQKADEAVVVANKFLDRANTATGLNYGCLHAGVSAFHQGKFRVSENLFREAGSRAEDNYGVDSGIKYISDVVLTALLFWRGLANDSANDIFEMALTHVEQFDGWLEIFAIGVDCDVEMGLINGDLAHCHAALDRAKRISADRGIKRLFLLSEAKRLRVLCSSGASEEATILATQLESEFTENCWRQAPGLWRPFIESALALFHYYRGRSQAKSLASLDGAIACCRAIGANFHLLRLLAARAEYLGHHSRKQDAMRDMAEAVTLAAPERILTPFLAIRNLRPLILALSRNAPDGSATFVAALLEAMAARRSEPASAHNDNFSPKELEVLRQLCAGQRNKEIARNTDISESTVKFHVKNIFLKLAVKSRAEAIVKAQAIGIFF